MNEMTPIDWAIRPLRKYAAFSGRAPRAEYWWYTLAAIIISVLAMLADSLIGSDFGGTGYGILYLIVVLGLLLPGLAAGVRRLHDIDRSGWWLLILFVPLFGLIVLIVFYVTPGTKGENRFGPDPYAGVS